MVGIVRRVTAPTLLIHGRARVVDGTLVMGVVNASPESFSDAGRYARLDDRLALCEQLVAEGADIIDVGGQSAITNRPEVDADEEVERVVPIVSWLRSHHPDVLVSVDTYKPSVAEAALAAGASIVNDVSGLRRPEIVDSCVRHGAALVVMHTHAQPLTRLQDRELYDDVAAEVVEFLAERTETAVAGGLDRESIILDPGPDFTKTPHQTVAVLRRIADVRALGRPVLLALSRKDFLGAVTGRPPRGRDAATHAAIAHFAGTAGNIVRVHDVAAARDVIATIEVLAGLREIEPDYLLPDEIRHERPGA
jgi:dihydropteroate synthase